MPGRAQMFAEPSREPLRGNRVEHARITPTTHKREADKKTRTKVVGDCIIEILMIPLSIEGPKLMLSVMFFLDWRIVTPFSLV